MCFIKIFKSVSRNMVKFYRLPEENRDEIFGKFLSHTCLERTHAHAHNFYYVSAVPGPLPLLKHKIWPR